MGCDVHPFHEILKDGKWQFTGEITKDPHADPEDYPDGCYLADGYFSGYFSMIDGKEKGKNGYYTRNYVLFGHLTGGQVRYSADEVNNLPKLLDPRGLPSDISPEVKLLADQDDCDGHSHSYHTLAELAQYATDLLMAGVQDNGPQSILEFIKYYRDDSIPLDQQRIVFWFDN